MRFHRTTYFAILLISLTMAGVASAQTISIVSGDGQLARISNPENPMVVVVKNAQGQPLPGVIVSWSVANGLGNLLSGDTTLTDANGLSQNTLSGVQVTGISAYAQSTITAAIAGSSVTFVETTAGIDVTTGASLVPVALIFPQLADDPLTGSAGSTGTQAIVVHAGSGTQGVPNILINLLPVDPVNGPTIKCSGTTGYTKPELNGTANCLPVFGGALGNSQYRVGVGGDFDSQGNYTGVLFPAVFKFTVTQGQFAAFRITGGDHQSGSPGARLPVQLTARTEDAAGNALPNVPVIWDAVDPVGGVVISQASSASDSSGNISATATLGGTTGAVHVRVRNQAGTIQGTFTLTVNLVVTGISKVAGDNQDAVVNSPYTQPLIVQLSTPQGPISGVQVQFSASGGVTFPNGAFATTDANGRAIMNVAAGATPGTAVVTASISGFSISFTLTIRLAGPRITINSFFNQPGGQPGGVSPSAVLAIFGEGIATGLQGCVAANQIIGPLPIQLSNVTVLFTIPNTTYAAYGPLYSVCNLGPGQEYVALQVPADLPVGTATVTVSVGASTTTVNNVPVTPFSVGILRP